MGANAVAAEDGTGVGLVGDGMVCMERRGRGLKREERYPRLFPCGHTGRDGLSFKSSRRKK